MKFRNNHKVAHPSILSSSHAILIACENTIIKTMVIGASIYTLIWTCDLDGHFATCFLMIIIHQRHFSQAMSSVTTCRAEPVICPPRPHWTLRILRFLRQTSQIVITRGFSCCWPDFGVLCISHFSRLKVSCLMSIVACWAGLECFVMLTLSATFSFLSLFTVRVGFGLLACQGSEDPNFTFGVANKDL